MIVSCSNCAARYAVDPIAVGPSGRTVECARCHHRWFQPADTNPPPPDLVIRPATPGVRAQLPAVIEPKPAFAWRRLAAAVAVVVLLVIAAAAYAFRHEITALMSTEASAARSALAALMARHRPAPPPTAGVQPAEPPPHAQLDIDFANSQIELVEGRYVVRGEIVNNGQAAGTTSTLRLTFKRDNLVLAERSYALVEGPIAPGARLAFRQPLDEPPEGTTDIVPTVE